MGVGLKGGTLKGPQHHVQVPRWDRGSKAQGQVPQATLTVDVRCGDGAMGPHNHMVALQWKQERPEDHGLAPRL